MKRILIPFLLLPLLDAGSNVLGQTRSDYDAFGITDDSEAAPPPAAADAPREKTAPAELSASHVDSGAAETATNIPVPSDWIAFSLANATAHVPPDWALVEDRDRSKLYFNGDMKTHAGMMFGLSLDQEKRLVPKDAKIASDRQVLIGGLPFRRLEMSFKLDRNTTAEAIVLISADPVEGNEHLVAHGMAINVPLAPRRAEIERLLSGVQIAATTAPASTQGTALGGLVNYDMPDDWVVNEGGSDDAISFWPRIYSGRISFYRGHAVTGPQGAESEIPPGTAAKKAVIFNQFSDFYSWPVNSRDFQVGAALLGGRTDYYRLLDCVDGDRVGIAISGAQEFFDGPDYEAAIAAITFDPSGMLGSCGSGDASAGQKPPVQAQAAPATVPAGSTPQLQAFRPAPEPETQSGPPAQAVRVSAIDVEGVTFLLPEDWKASYDKPDNKIFESPDGKWSLLAFWWFPDEPLLGYDDITGVDNVIIDHEPVTRISHVFPGNRLSIQNVTERARGDKKRFIFTLEGTDASEDDLAALHNWFIASLHLQGGFDPAKRVEPVPGKPVPGTAADASPSVPAVSPDGNAVVGAAPHRFSFADGLQGWTGDHAVLSVQPSGGPDDTGVLEAFCAGDGVNGYMVAPDTLLGDWSAIGGLRLSVRTGTGTYVDPYSFGGRGDIHIESNGKSASIAFPSVPGRNWQTEEVSFLMPGWRLKGTTSIAEILADVTALHIRVEYLSGDATAWVSSIELLPANSTAGVSETLPEAPAGSQSTTAPIEAWQQYVNDRFGTHIEYPSGLFRALPPPQNGDGRTFAAPDKNAQFFVFGQFNYDNLDARGLMARDRRLGNYDQVTYSKVGHSYYVLSGYRDGGIFYRKAIMDRIAETVHVFEITYPTAAREEFDPIVRRMAESFGHP